MEPRKTLLYALARFDENGLRDPFAVDLGCGSGRDTIELLRRGWKVLAIDGEAEAIERLLASEELPSAAAERLSTQVSRFEDAAWPDVDLVNSSFALPFCPPEAFPRLWQRIKSSVRVGGRFSGQLFGDRDGWSGERELTFIPEPKSRRCSPPLRSSGSRRSRKTDIPWSGNPSAGISSTSWHVGRLPEDWRGGQHRSTDHPDVMCLNARRTAPREGVGPTNLAGGGTKTCPDETAPRSGSFPGRRAERLLG
jgi:SAM-dependent methyltransferase